LSDAQRVGDEPLPVTLGAGPLVQRAFAVRLSELSPVAREALLVLAVSGDGDTALRAVEDRSGAGLVEAESAGLVVRGSRFDFRHPLMRGAVYGAAAPAERRAAHRALAAVTSGARRAWHLADAQEGLDEKVAETLEEAAREAAVAGGVAAQAQAFERAAELTPESERRVTRLVEAARAWRLSGRIDHVDEVLERALGLATDPRTRAQVQLERGRALVRKRENQQAIELLVAEAERVESLDRKIAGLLYVEAAQAAEVHLGAARTRELAERAHALAGADGDRSELAAVNMLIAARAMSNAPPETRDAELLDRAHELLERAELRVGAEEAHWISYCLAVHERDADARRMSDRAMGEARDAGDVWSLCFGLYARAAIESATGRVDVAHSYALDAVALAEEIGETWRLGEAYAILAEVEAARGDVQACERRLDARRPHVDEAAYKRDWAWAVSLPLGRALVAVGKHDSAVPELEAALAFSRTVAGPRTWYHLVPLELAEAYASIGRARDAEALLREAAPAIESCALVRPKAKLARLRGLLAAEGAIDSTFAQALAHLEAMPQHLETSRVELNWGERLRRAGRSADAVRHLGNALARFEALGASGWAARTRAEFEAASGGVRPAKPRRVDVLTAQELRVSVHAAAGLRDREIAARLYLSPRTVEAYLQSAYRKLGVSNRTQLAGVLAADGIAPEPAAKEP
jgi:DNA-binding CsgD family transcriptional regulator